MFRVGVEWRVSLSSLSAGNMPAGFESDPRTERKPKLFQKDRDRAKNESFAIGLAGRKSHLLPKIGGARKKWFHQDPVPSTDGGVSFLCPLSSGNRGSGTCASLFLLIKKKASYCFRFPHCFKESSEFDLCPAKPYTYTYTYTYKLGYLFFIEIFLFLFFVFESIPHFSSYPSAFSCAGQPSEALFELEFSIQKSARVC